MQITVNGKDRRTAAGTTVAALLAALGVDPKTVVVELNRDIPGRDSWGELTLSEGDAVEIIRLVSGG